MFDDENRSFNPLTGEYGPSSNPFDPQQDVQTQQPAGGSYYSPRSGGGYVPPTGGYDNGISGGDEPPKKKSHKGLKAMAIFASVAFVAYFSIQCYQFATQNKEMNSFLGKQETAEITQQTDESGTAKSADSQTTEGKSKSNNNTDTSAAQPMSFIELASRENAMSIPDIVDKVTPATVGVASTFVYEGQSYSMWGFGFGMPQQTTETEMPATGTGIIMSDNGNGSYYIITNAHVIYDSSEKYHMGRAKDVSIVLNGDYYEDDTALTATIVGYDVAEDIAVLKVTTNQKLTVAEFGSSDDLRVGELVVAIGNPLGFELFGSVTTGIVSALDREVTINDSKMKLIQTDTAINSGNSGGPLINSYGQVIGINSSKISSSYSSESASVEGLCFAIPISHAKDVINDLINYGYVTGKPMIGVSGEDVTERISQIYGMPVGVYVSAVEKGGPADLAGIRIGDVIIAINGETISTYEELNEEKDKYKAGDTITLTVTRAGQDMDFSVVLQEKVPTETN